MNLILDKKEFDNSYIMQHINLQTKMNLHPKSSLLLLEVLLLVGGGGAVAGGAAAAGSDVVAAAVIVVVIVGVRGSPWSPFNIVL